MKSVAPAVFSSAVVFAEGLFLASGISYALGLAGIKDAPQLGGGGAGSCAATVFIALFELLMIGGAALAFVLWWTFGHSKAGQSPWSAACVGVAIALAAASPLVTASQSGSLGAALLLSATGFAMLSRLPPWALLAPLPLSTVMVGLALGVGRLKEVAREYGSNAGTAPMVRSTRSRALSG